MKVLSLDPGSVRMGWAVLEREGEEPKKSKPRLVGSGVFGLTRHSNEGKDEPYQMYRLRLIDFWVREAEALLNSYQPDEVVSEIVPVVGGGNFVAATLSQLASTAVTAVQAMAFRAGIVVKQIGATTIKKRIGGKNTATKVKVRNGVMEILPELAERKSSWVKIFEEPDAIAVGLTELGYGI